MKLSVRKASQNDVPCVSGILTEAAAWLDLTGKSLWRADELVPGRIREEMRTAEYYLAYHGGDAVGTFRFQLNDALVWPDVPEDESAFVHRVAVRRSVAGNGVAGLMLDWVKGHAVRMSRRYLRLDCAIRPQLCALYERNGFMRHSEWQVGPYYVIRYECDLKQDQGL